MSKKETLNLLIADGSESKSYIDYLNIIFNVNVLEPSTKYRSSEIDLILFTGGADINPELYEQTIGKFINIDKERDQKEIDIYWRYQSIPKLGICRGSQLLTVLSGGELIQHTTGHTKEHYIDIKRYGKRLMTSTHHQMMYPYKLSPEAYVLHGWSSKFLSDTYLNGNNEEIKLSSDFLEPEIVEYKYSKCFCIQGHPEFGSEEIKEITLLMISDFLKRMKIKKPSLGKILDEAENHEEQYDDYDFAEEFVDEKSLAKKSFTYTIKESHRGKVSYVDMDSIPKSFGTKISEPIKLEPLNFDSEAFENYKRAMSDSYSKLNINKINGKKSN